MHSRILRILSSLTVIAAITMVVRVPANADPLTQPAKNNIVGVGSATTQYVVDKYTKNFPGPGTAANPKWASWNAVGSANITPAATCASIPRPNGSSAGLTVLASLGSGTSTAGCVDFARSSRGPKTTGNNFAFFAFARDGLTWASWGATGAPLPASLSTAQLKNIYQSSTGVAGGPCIATNWNQVGGQNAVIKPAIPQSGSGSRDFFLAAIGVTALCNVPTYQESDGVSLASAVGGQLTNAIAPYSIADYIAQRNTGTTGVPDLRNGLTLGKVNGTSPCTAASNCSGAGQTLNPSLSAAFQRLVYNVVKTSNAAGTVIPAYLAKFGTVGQGGAICSNPALISTYGFAPLGAGCGAITFGGLNP
ncbi:MAG: substrate-binding domain-containing protein [Nocardioides sp.]